MSKRKRATSTHSNRGQGQPPDKAKHTEQHETSDVWQCLRDAKEEDDDDAIAEQNAKACDGDDDDSGANANQHETSDVWQCLRDAKEEDDDDAIAEQNAKASCDGDDDDSGANANQHETSDVWQCLRDAKEEDDDDAIADVHSNRGAVEPKHVSFADDAPKRSSGASHTEMDRALHGALDVSLNAILNRTHSVKPPERPALLEDVISMPAPIALPTQQLAVRAGEMPIVAITVDPASDARAPPKMNIYASIAEWQLLLQQRITRSDGSTTSGADIVMDGLGLTAHFDQQADRHATRIPTEGVGPVINQLKEIISRLTDQQAAQAHSAALLQVLRAPGRVQQNDPLVAEVRTLQTMVAELSTQMSVGFNRQKAQDARLDALAETAASNKKKLYYVQQQQQKEQSGRQGNGDATGTSAIGQLPQSSKFFSVSAAPTTRYSNAQDPRFNAKRLSLIPIPEQQMPVNSPQDQDLDAARAARNEADFQMALTMSKTLDVQYYGYHPGAEVPNELADALQEQHDGSEHINQEDLIQQDQSVPTNGGVQQERPAETTPMAANYSNRGSGTGIFSMSASEKNSALPARRSRFAADKALEFDAKQCVAPIGVVSNVALFAAPNPAKDKGLDISSLVDEFQQDLEDEFQEVLAEELRRSSAAGTGDSETAASTTTQPRGSPHRKSLGNEPTSVEETNAKEGANSIVGDLRNETEFQDELAEELRRSSAAGSGDTETAATTATQPRGSPHRKSLGNEPTTFEETNAKEAANSIVGDLRDETDPLTLNAEQLNTMPTDLEHPPHMTPPESSSAAEHPTSGQSPLSRSPTEVVQLQRPGQDGNRAENKGNAAALGEETNAKDRAASPVVNAFDPEEMGIHSEQQKKQPTSVQPPLSRIPTEGALAGDDGNRNEGDQAGLVERPDAKSRSTSVLVADLHKEIESAATGVNPNIVQMNIMPTEVTHPPGDDGNNWPANKGDRSDLIEDTNVEKRATSAVVEDMQKEIESEVTVANQNTVATETEHREDPSIIAQAAQNNPKEKKKKTTKPKGIPTAGGVELNVQGSTTYERCTDTHAPVRGQKPVLYCYYATTAGRRRHHREVRDKKLAKDERARVETILANGGVEQPRKEI